MKNISHIFSFRLLVISYFTMYASVGACARARVWMYKTDMCTSVCMDVIILTF